MKKLSVFDLKEGVEYDAFLGSKKVGKRFRVVNGQLQNDQGQGLGQYEGCSWVPMNANVTFKPRTKAPRGSKGLIAKQTKGQEVSVIHLQKGSVYENYYLGRIARKGNTLFQVDSKNRLTEKLPSKNIALNTTFTLMGKSSKAKAPRARAS